MHHDIDEVLAPTVARLFQAIQGLSEVAEFASRVGSVLPRRLKHVDVLLSSEFSIQISYFDLMSRTV
jgi:hypothetical protein